MGKFWVTPMMIIFVGIFCLYFESSADASDETTEDPTMTESTETPSTTTPKSTTQIFEHYGNYKEKKNVCYPRHCPQLSPNYNNEHRLQNVTEFQNVSFFACDHIYNKANSSPGDYNIMGNYSSWGVTCAPDDKNRRDEINFLELRRVGQYCEEEADKKCPGEVENHYTT